MDVVPPLAKPWSARIMRTGSFAFVSVKFYENTFEKTTVSAKNMVLLQFTPIKKNPGRCRECLEPENHPPPHCTQLVMHVSGLFLAVLENNLAK